MILVESTLVGIYSFFIYFCFQSIQPFELMLFLTGMIKHYMGYWLGLQSLFCSHRKGLKHVTPPPLYEIVLEGGVFLVLGKLLSLVILSKGWIMFLIGFILHTLAELSGVHTTFLKQCY